MIKEKIISAIKKKPEGISLENFIQICLFDKDGYYNNLNPLGKSGDFITAPEISQLFGEIIGIYIFDLWEKKYNCKVDLIELGPGNGTLLQDILRITKFLPKFHRNLDIHLIEKNFHLMNKQKNNFHLNIFDHLNFKWHKHFDNVNNKLPVIIIANEFFDCFPIRQFSKTNNRWYEKCINFDFKEDKFFYQNLVVEEDFLLKKILKYKEVDILEISEQREVYFDLICKYINQNTGTCIIIDYGYYDSPKHFTLQSIFNHKHSNLLDNPGKQDITSYVDFKKLINIAKNYNLKIDLFDNQKDFLINNGIIERKNKIVQKCNKNQKKIFKSGYKKLIDDEEMGSTFKFLIFSNISPNVN